MIESLDVRTLAVVGWTVFLSISVILTLVYFTRRVYAGFGHWVLWQLSATAGVLVFALRGAEPSPLSIMLTNFLLLMAPALLFHGMARFLGLYRSPWPIRGSYVLVAAALAGQAYVTVVTPDLDARMLIFAGTRAILLCRTAIEPLLDARGRRSASLWVLCGIVALMTVNEMHHAWMALQPEPINDPLVSDHVRFAILVAVIGDVIAAYGLMLLTSERLEAELLAMRHDVELLARTDSLTGAWNRRHFEEVLAVEVERARRYGLPVALLILDADHFKRINDAAGHQAGDAVLCALSALLARQIRRSDVLCRWGGEEFIVLAPETDQVQAVTMAEKIRRAVAGHDFAAADRVTVSIGVGELSEGESAEHWLQRVDAALYAAKQAGRDRVSVAGSPTMATA